MQTREIAAEPYRMTLSVTAWYADVEAAEAAADEVAADAPGADILRTIEYLPDGKPEIPAPTPPDEIVEPPA